MGDILTKRIISHAEAYECVSRFITSHWNRGGDRARFTIPANIDRDDDLILCAYIDQRTADGATLRMVLKLSEAGFGSPTWSAVFHDWLWCGRALKATDFASAVAEAHAIAFPSTTPTVLGDDV